MPDSSMKTREQLLVEVTELQARIAGLEKINSQHSQSKELLWESERKSRAWLEFSPVCTKIVDLDFNLQYMSNVGISGLQIEDIRPYYGKPFPFDLYSESSRDRMASFLKTLRKPWRLPAGSVTRSLSRRQQAAAAGVCGWYTPKRT